MLEFHDPRAAVAVEREPYGLGIDLMRMNDACIAFLANGFPDSEKFLEKVAGAMERILPQIKVLTFNKGNASIAAPAEMLEEIQNNCQAAVTAYGH